MRPQAAISSLKSSELADRASRRQSGGGRSGWPSFRVPISVISLAISEGERLNCSRPHGKPVPQLINGSFVRLEHPSSQNVFQPCDGGPLLRTIYLAMFRRSDVLGAMEATETQWRELLATMGEVAQSSLDRLHAIGPYSSIPVNLKRGLISETTRLLPKGNKRGRLLWRPR
jgi:hypothetical protein